MTETLDLDTGQRTYKRHWRKEVFQLGRYDTVYIVVSEENMQTCAPLIIGFLGDIQRQVYAQHRADELHGVRERRPPVLWAIDELASCPVPLPTILRDAGSQGLLILGALHDLTQTTAKWGEEGKALPTLFNNVVVTPGIRDTATLQQLSQLVGDYSQEVWGGSYSHGQYGKEWNSSLHFERRPRLSVDDLYAGNPHDPDAALVFFANKWHWVTLQLYYRTYPWPFLLYLDAFLFKNGDPRLWIDGLPYPQIARNGDYTHLAAMSPSLPGNVYYSQKTYKKALAGWRATVGQAHEEALQEAARRAIAPAPSNVIPLHPEDEE